MAHLIFENGPNAGESYPVRDEPITIGRSNLSHIQINDRRVSRNHAVLKYLHGTFVVEDISSRNGTLLNGSLLNGRKRLIHGDKISIGDIILVFELDPYTQDVVGSSTGKEVKVVDMNLPADMSIMAIDSDFSVKLGTDDKSSQEKNDALLKLQTIYQITTVLRENADLNTILSQVTDVIFDIMAPDRIIIFLNKKTGSTNIEPAIVRVSEKVNKDQDINVSQGVLEKSVSDLVGVLISDTSVDERFATNSSIMAGQIKSVISAPLVVNGELIGALYLDRQYHSASSFSNADLDFLVSIANHTATVILNARLHQQALTRQRLEKELEIAHQIQTNLLPNEAPSLPGLDISGMSIPARQVGGDCYDFFPMGENLYGFMVLDVSGKGVPAAILTASIRASLRVEAIGKTSRPVEHIVESVNSWTCRDTTYNMFATMVLTIYDPETRTFQYTVAGHVPPLIIRQNGTIERLDKGGCFLGIMEPVDYESGSFTLNAGDILVLYSDGVTDAHNFDKERFGEERLIRLLLKNRELCATELRDEIYEAVLKFSNSVEQFDDLTLVIIKVLDNPDLIG